MAITLSQLQSSCPCFQVDDIAFLGDKPHDHLTLEKFGVWVTHQEWFQPLLSSLPFKNLPKLLEDPINDRLVGFGCFQLLQEAYAHAKHRLATPSWLQFIPQEIRHLLDCGWFKIEADAYNIVPYTAHTGFGFVVLNDGLIEATDRTFGLHRLAGINQLASLHSPVVSGDALSEHPMKFTHTRYLHSLEVSAGATLIGNPCKI
jgi:hypothetical protein